MFKLTNDKMAAYLFGRKYTWEWITRALEELTQELRQQHPLERCYRQGSWTKQQVRRAVRAWRAICEKEGGEAAALSMRPATHPDGSPGTEDPHGSRTPRVTRWH